METLLTRIEEALQGRHHPKCMNCDCDCGRDLTLEGLLEMVASDLRVQADQDHEIKTHVNWLKGYVGIMNENNWRDMRLYCERQLAELALIYGKPPAGEQIGEVADTGNRLDAREPAPTMFLVESDRAVCFGGRWHGWLFWLHPNGNWVSARKLPETEPIIDPLFSQMQEKTP